MSRFIILRSGLKSLIGPGMVFMLSVSPAMAYTDRNDIEFHVTGNIIAHVTSPNRRQSTSGNITGKTLP